MKKLLYYILPALMLITMIAAFPKASYAGVETRNCVVLDISPSGNTHFYRVLYKGKCPTCGYVYPLTQSSSLLYSNGSTSYNFCCPKHNNASWYTATVKISLPDPNPNR